MAGMEVRITGPGVEGLVALQRRLYEISEGGGDRSINGMLRARMRTEMAPAKAAVQQAVLALPSHGSSGSAHTARGGKSGRSTGLRQRVSQLVQVKASTTGRNVGVRIRIDSSRMPGDQKSLPAMLEGAKPWRHPVFGNSDVWVNQASHPYFWRTVNAGRDRWRTAVLTAMRDVAAYVNRH